MKNRIITGEGNSNLVKMAIPDGMTWAQFKEAARAGTLPADIVATTDGTGTTEVGTPLIASNLLKDETATSLGMRITNPTVDDAFSHLAGYLTWEDVAYAVSLQRTSGNARAEITGAYRMRGWLVMEVYYWLEGATAAGQNVWTGNFSMPWTQVVNVREATFLSPYVMTSYINTDGGVLVRTNSAINSTTSALIFTYRIPIR